MEERQGQAGADARRRRSQDETFMYRWAVLALHLLCDVSPHLSISGDWDRRAADRALVTKIVWALSVLCLVTALSCVAFRDPGVLRDAIPKKTGTQLALERPSSHVSTARRVLRRGSGVGRRGFDQRLIGLGTGIGQRNMGAFT